MEMSHGHQDILLSHGFSGNIPVHLSDMNLITLSSKKKGCHYHTHTHTQKLFSCHVLGLWFSSVPPCKFRDSILRPRPFPSESKSHYALINLALNPIQSQVTDNTMQ